MGAKAASISPAMISKLLSLRLSQLLYSYSALDVLLVYSNAAYLAAAASHYAYRRAAAASLYAAVGFVGMKYHSHCHVNKLFDSAGQRWQTADLLCSRVEFVYNFLRWSSARHTTLLLALGIALKVTSVFFWLRAGRWWTRRCVRARPDARRRDPGPC